MAKSKTAKAPAASDLKERCPRCVSEDFVSSKDVSQKRYCQKCGHVWLPLSKDAIEVGYLTEEVSKLREENSFLKDRVKALESQLHNPNENTQEGIFS